MSFFQDWVNTGSFSGAYFMRATGSPLANMSAVWEAPHQEKTGKAKTGLFSIFSFVDHRRAGLMIPGLGDTIARGQRIASQAWMEQERYRREQTYARSYPELPPVGDVTPRGYVGVSQWDDPTEWGPGF